MLLKIREISGKTREMMGYHAKSWDLTHDLSWYLVSLLLNSVATKEIRLRHFQTYFNGNSNKNYENAEIVMHNAVFSIYFYPGNIIGEQYYYFLFTLINYRVIIKELILVSIIYSYISTYNILSIYRRSWTHNIKTNKFLFETYYNKLPGTDLLLYLCDEALNFFELIFNLKEMNLVTIFF